MTEPKTNRSVASLTICLLAALICGCQAGEPKAERDWNVLLLTLDTTRADFIGCYGKKNAQTPNLDGLAAEGFLFENNFASNPVTQPSHSTILTGVYPMVHGVRDNSLFKLPDQRTTLAEALGAAGWATGAAIGGFPLVREFGLSQGFDFYDDDITGNREDFRGRPAQRHGGTWYDERPAAEVNDAILPWLREHVGGPFFIWLHYWDPHLPHIAPPPYGQIYAHDPYQGEIAYADASLGTILRELQQAGVYDRTLVIVTSDHGEGRNEHNEMTHAFLAYDSTLHVPLIMKVPGMEGGRRIRQRVGTVDIVPTVLDLLGIEGPKELQGRSLAPLMRGPENGGSPPLYYSESISPRLSHGFGELRVLYDGRLKYIFGPRPELFDLEADPLEIRNLIPERSDEALRLEAELGVFIHEHASPDAAAASHEVDEATRLRLEALGYLDAGGEGGHAVEETLSRAGIPPQDRVGDINLASRLRAQLGQGQFAAARQTAERLLVGAPTNVFYRSSLARALIGLKKPLEAAEVVEKGEDLGGGQQAVFLQVAQGVFDAGERDRGRALAAKIATDDDTAGARVVLASMAREAGDVPAFEKEIKRALELDPNNAPARLERARYELDTGDLDGAERDLRALLEDQPLSLEGQLGWARLLRARGEREEALGRVERVLRLAPRSCDARVDKLQLLVDLDRHDEAVTLQRDIGRECRDEKWVARTQKIMGDA